MVTLHRTRLLCLYALFLGISNSFHSGNRISRTVVSKLDIAVSSVQDRSIKRPVSGGFKITPVTPKFVTAPKISRSELGSKLTVSNRRNQDMGIKLRTQYNKLRSLTLEEERTAGKIGFIGKRLKNIKKTVAVSLSREPTDEEWAAACRLDVSTLYQYLDLSTKARNRLVQHNMRLVDYWVTQMLAYSDVAKDIAYIDLVAEGVVGLTRAAENYNGKSRFGPYATVWIRSELYRGLSRLRPGNLANHRKVMFMYRIKKAEYLLTEQLGRKPSDEEIAKEMHMRMDTLKAIRASNDAKIISADAPIDESNEDNIGTYKDLFLKADQTNYSSEMLMWKVQFLSALDVLTPSERRTLSLRYGLLDGVPKKVDTTAEMMAMTNEAVRITIKKSLGKLKASAFSQFLEDGVPKAPVTTFDGMLSARSY